MKKNSLARAAHIRKRAEFLQIQKKSKRISGRYLIITYAFKDVPSLAEVKEKAFRSQGIDPSVICDVYQYLGIFTRLGIVATKKIGNAVVRNRGKRLIRDAFRRHQEKFSKKLDLVIILRQGIHKATQDEIDQEIISASKKIK